MVKGTSRRVIVVDSPDTELFEQAIFIVRNDAMNRNGVTAQRLVDEACRVARTCGRTATCSKRSFFRRGSPALWGCMGGGGCGVAGSLRVLILSIFFSPRFGGGAKLPRPIFLRKTANQRKFLIYKRLSIDYTITYRILFDEVIAMNADFSRTLALLRQEKGISQRKAAKELGISQALLSHYENGIREPGLAFVKKACDYYHVSADYLLGRTLDRDGGMIDAESLYDSSDEKGTLRGSIAATLQKKMLVNTAGVLFELLGKTNDRTLITSAGSYLGGAFYQLYRALHRASGGKEGYFGLDATAYQSGAVDAQMRADYIAYASSLAQLSEKDGAFASMEDEALASLYPGLMQSVTQVLHSTEEKTNSLLGRK